MSSDKTDVRTIVAAGFDGVATMLGKFGTHPGLALGSGIATAVAALVRTLGVESAHDAIAELVSRKDEGKITDEHVARDDDSIVAAVASLYGDDD